MCPHCGQDISIPYERISSHNHRILGKLSASKRQDAQQRMSTMARAYWSTYENPTEKAILALAQADGFEQLTFKQIAERIGVTSKYPESYVQQNISRLRKKGLLPPSKPQRIRQAILDLAAREELAGLPLKEIARKVGITSPYCEQYISHYLSDLRKGGLLPPIPSPALHPTQQAILDLAKREDISRLTIPQIVERSGLTGKHIKRYTWYHVHQLEKKGLLPKRPHL